MSTINRRTVLAALCTAALVFALAVGVDAQSNKPIDEDDIVASVVVGAELITIAYIRKRYMDTPFLSAAFQVIVGGLIVLATGILIGKS